MNLDKIHKLAQQLAEKPSTNTTVADLEAVLEKANMLGRSKRGGAYERDVVLDPNSRVMRKIVSILNSLDPPYRGVFSVFILVDPKMRVMLKVTGDRAEELQPKMQAVFSGPMHYALKKSKLPGPNKTLQIDWILGMEIAE
jgi:hypothetical protein